MCGSTPSGAGNLITSVTYSQFASAVANSQLIPGMVYRITDYVTKINGVYDLSSLNEQMQGMYMPYATSAEHAFDLLVLATGADTYNENVKAIQHSGDTYFAHSDLAAWELKWTHENDRSRFSFADETNGKGVIFYMRDEYDNSAFYDFKNVMNIQLALEREDSEDDSGYDFEYNNDSSSDDYNPNRYGTAFDVLTTVQSSSIGNNLQLTVPEFAGMPGVIMLLTITDISKGALDATMDWTYPLAFLSAALGETVTLEALAEMTGIQVEVLEALTERQVIQNFFNADFYYTFNYNDGGTFYDLSSYYYYDDQEDTEVFGGSYCFSNHIGKSSDSMTRMVEEVETIPYGLPCITFENNVKTTVSGNEFGSDCFLTVFGEGCLGNKIGDLNYTNKFAKNCYHNIFGNFCSESMFGDSNYYNVFGGGASDVYFGTNCYYNHLGGASEGIKFGGGCRYNSLGSGCAGIELGDSCWNISFGNCCSSSYIGDLGNNLSFGNGCHDNNLDDDCAEISFGEFCGYNYVQPYSYGISFGNEIDYITIDDNTRYVIIENGVRYVTLDGTGGTGSNLLQNVKICQGVHGSSSSNRLTITATRDLDYQVEYKAQGSTEIILGGNN